MSPENLWLFSSKLWHRGFRLVPKILKVLNYFLYRAILPPECELDGKVVFLHRALGVVVSPKTRLGQNVTIAHRVTIAEAGHYGTVIGDDVSIGVGASLIPTGSRNLVIASGTSIGANALVIKDTQLGQTLVSAPALLLDSARGAKDT